MKKILLDVGGTSIKCSDGREIPINSNGTAGEIYSSLREAVSDYDCVRAAVPGPFNYQTGQFLMKHKFAAVYGEYFQDIVGVKDCKFIHDVNCMLLGEVAAGKGKDYRKVALVALGTGLGFAVSIDGIILQNESGGPEISLYNRPYKDGILEDYASKRGMYANYGGDTMSVKEIGLRASEGEQRALDAFAAMGRVIGTEISPLMKEYDIERLLMGGQISRNWKFILPAIEEEFKKAGLNTGVTIISDFDNATFNGLKAL